MYTLPLPDWLNLKLMAKSVPVELLEPRGDNAVYPASPFISGDNAEAPSDITVARENDKAKPPQERKADRDHDDDSSSSSSDGD